MEKEETVRTSLGTPISLCYACANAYAEVYAVRKVSGSVDHTVVCEGCRKRRMGAAYEIGGRK